jgi:hypothetical protein
MELWVDAARKKDALVVVKEFRESIEEGKINPPLSPRTVTRKKKKGYSKPTYPLRGLGMEAARTYARSMRIYKTKGGWRVRMPAVKHHESKLKMDILFQIHEYGATTKNGAYIPSRPALARAYQKVLRDIAAGEVAQVQAACTEYLSTGKTHKGDAILGMAAYLEKKYGHTP